MAQSTFRCFFWGKAARCSIQPRRLKDTMTTELKIIRAKVRLLELATQLGNVS
jgi:hypothetical protein